jgi:hypothetical protein
VLFAAQQMEQVLAACFQVGLQGEADRGNGGVIYLEDEKVGYMLLHEVEPQELRERLAAEIEDDDGRNFFILHRHEGSVHVSKLARQPR